MIKNSIASVSPRDDERPRILLGSRSRASLLVAVLLGAGCTGVLGDGGQDPGESASSGRTDAASGGMTAGSGGAVAGSGATVAGSGGSAPSSSSTGGGSSSTVYPAAAASPLVRLTSKQYSNALHDLFAPITVPDQNPPPDPTVNGFDDDATTQTPSPALIEAYHTSAVVVAEAAMQSAAQLLGCTPATRDEEDACAQTFLSTFGRRAFRHTLASDELSDLVTFYTNQRAGGGDFPTAMTLTIEDILQSPSFLYRVEIGTPIPSEPTAVMLTPYEVASRLSYLLLDSMPDDALFAAADTTELTTPAGVETQARRLLADPRARTAVANFHRQWLKFDKMKSMPKDAASFPAFTAATADALHQSAVNYVDNIFFGEGTLTALLTDSHAYVNDDLAPIYGVAPPGSTDLTLVPVDPTRRSGILTNAGLLSAFAHETEDSPVLRGVFVLDRIMCSPPPPPPPNVNMSVAAPSSNAPMTTRQIFATQHEQGSCAGCHHKIDGIGFAFEHYDATGAWRDKDDGLDVDSSAWFVASGASDLTGTFDGAVDLGKKLAASRTVQECVAMQWMRYALGVDPTGIDRGKLQAVVDAFVASDLDMREMLIAMVKSEPFLTRVVAP